MRPAPTGTPVYARQHARGLTLPQLNAVDLLVAGKTDTEAAALLTLHRTTVTKWRLYDPVFQAALNQRRAEVWAAGADRLRALIPKALDALAGELDGPPGPDRLRAAVALLRLLPPLTGPFDFGPTEPDGIVRRVVTDRRAATRGPLDELLDDGKGLPPVERHVRQVWAELDARAREPDADPPPTAGSGGGSEGGNENTNRLAPPLAAGTRRD